MLKTPIIPLNGSTANTWKRQFLVLCVGSGEGSIQYFLMYIVQYLHFLQKQCQEMFIYEPTPILFQFHVDIRIENISNT